MAHRNTLADDGAMPEEEEPNWIAFGIIVLGGLAFALLFGWVSGRLKDVSI